MCFSGDNQANSAPFVTVAMAGHATPSGRYCDCGTEDCICAPGETPIGQRITTSKSQQGESETINVSHTAIDEVGLGFLAITTLLLLLKLRA